ncbi:putative N-acetyltransferase YjaB [compost metagenome]
MLFVNPAARGRGIGKQLVTYAVQTLNVLYVDVNEQNPQAIGFYEHLGFRVFDRSERDEQGQPFPILHMKLS